MKSWISDLPVYSKTPFEIDAKVFNKVQLALKRGQCPLRMEIAGLRHVEMIFDQETWLCVDESNGDLPIMVWLDFEKARDSLHMPIKCTLQTYHAKADMLIETLLEAISSLLTDHDYPDIDEL